MPGGPLPDRVLVTLETAAQPASRSAPMISPAVTADARRGIIGQE